MAVLAQMKILTKLELCNLYGLNVLRFSRDRTAKKRAGAMLAVWMVLAVVLIVYTGGLSYGLYSHRHNCSPAFLSSKVCIYAKICPLSWTIPFSPHF